nr:unnamed protein product [Callosobruchus chinensis]
MEYIKNYPDKIVLLDHQQKTMFVIEFSAPAEVNIVSKEEEKRTKYQELLGQLRRIWPDYAVSLLVMVIGSLGGMRNTLLSALRAIPVCRAAAHILAARMQKAVTKYQELLGQHRRLWPDYAFSLLVMGIGSLGGMRNTLLSALRAMPVCRAAAHILAARMQKARCPSEHRVQMNNQVLPRSHSFKLLGVSTTENMIWHEHVSSIATAAGKKLGYLFRARKYFSPSNLLTLYKTQIRPSLEYCSHV